MDGDATPATSRARPAAASVEPGSVTSARARRRVTSGEAAGAGDAAAIAELSAAGPTKRARKPRARPAVAPPDRLDTLVEAVRRSLEDDKAEALVVLDVTDRASFTDRMIIATGLADRQIQAMATHLEEALAAVGMKLSRNAIQASPDWVLIDAGDLVIHLFKPEARAVYALERMWGPDSPQGDPAGEARDGAR